MKTWLTAGGVKIIRVLSGRCNCHLITGKNGLLLVDSSVKRKRKTLYRRLHALGAGEERPLTLVLTHAHFDHATNAAALQREFGALVIVNEREAEILEQGENPPIHGTLPPTRNMTRILNRSPWLRQLARYTGVVAVRTVSGETDLNPLGFPARILPTPGHTPGSMSVIVDDETALVGDALFGVFPGSAFPPFGADVKQVVRSWKTLLDTGCSLFLPAHGLARSRELLQRQYEKYSSRFGL